MRDTMDRPSDVRTEVRPWVIATMAALSMLAGDKARGQDGPPPDVLAESVLTEVEFRGRVNVGLAEIEARSGLKKGAKVDVFRIAKGVQDILNLYREAGYVGTEAKLIEGDSPGDARVVIEIIEGSKPIPGISAVPSTQAIPVIEEGKSVYNTSFGPDGLKVGDAFQHAHSEELEAKAGVHLDRANQARKAREFKRALAEATAAIRLTPYTPDVYQNRGMIYTDMGLYRRAIVDFTKAIKIRPNAEYYLNRGYAYCLDRDFERGFADLDAGIFRSAGLIIPLSGAHYFRGAARSLQGEHGLAVADFNRAIALGLDRDDDFSMSRGHSLAALREHDRAISDFDRIIAIHPSAEAWYFRGQSHFALGKFALAQDDYERAIELDPKNDRYHDGRTWARLARGQVDGAIEGFTRSVNIAAVKPWTDQGWIITDLKPLTKSPSALTGRGWAYLLKHDLDRAIEDFDDAIALQSPRVILLANWRCTKSLGLLPMYDRATVEFEERRQESPNIPFALVILSGDQARSQLLRNPYFAAYLVGRTRACSEGAPDFIFQIAVDWRSFSDETSALFGRAVAAMLRSDWPGAREHFKGALLSLAEARQPGLLRPPLAEILREN